MIDVIDDSCARFQSLGDLGRAIPVPGVDVRVDVV
jgi:hypothetical protein